MARQKKEHKTGLFQSGSRGSSEVLPPVCSVSDARSRLYRLVDQVAESHEPVRITGKRASAVLVSEEDWSAIQETLYLCSIPGMRESLLAGAEEPVDECSEEPGW